MSEKCIHSVHIQKLGHKILEIRERALKNIISKLENGYIFDNDLARSKEILQKLFDWFLFPECSCEDLVLKLIRDILETESGKMLLKYYSSKKVVNELKQICNYTEPTYHDSINEIVRYIEDYCKAEVPIVPPLLSDIPLSYRSGEQYIPFPKASAESTATTIKGVVQGSSSNEQQAGVEFNNVEFSVIDTPTSDKFLEQTDSYLPYFYLSWYSLINTDRHVLESVENSLKNPSEISSLLHTCEFFSDVMLHDFPAEVFLQRPTILFELQRLILSCNSSRIKAAVLKALIKFTKLLKVRINYYNDPSMYNLKQFFLSQASSNSSPIDPSINSDLTSYRSNISSDIENSHTVNVLKVKQLPLPYYCLNTITHILDYLSSRTNNTKEAIYGKRWMRCTVRSLFLLSSLMDLLELCLNKKIWDCSGNDAVRDVIKTIREILIKFGDTIEYVRLETISSDFEANTRFIHISLLNSCLKLLSVAIADDKIDVILPRNLKNVITITLLDSALSRLYPGIQVKLLELVEKFNGRYENDTFTKYQDVQAVCESMKFAVKFLKNHKSLPIDECVLLVKMSLKSLDFHKKLSLIRSFIEICANKLPLLMEDRRLRENIAEIILELLRHGDDDIRRETFRLCAKRVIGAVGPKLNTSKSGAPGSQILFLMQSSILNEIALNGLSSKDLEIQKLSEDILIHILKCKILVTEDIWNSVVEALILTFPSLLCFVDQTTPIGRTLMSFLDPDTAQSMGLTTLEILKGNCCLLFSEDSSVRDEAVSRLCWFLASQGDTRDLLPRINNLFDKSLGLCCQIRHVYDLNKVQATQHYYQSSSLQQVLELLSSSNIEPVIRRSALTQISVMLEDPMLHNIFLQRNGVKAVINVMNSALDDSDYKDYPDSVIPAASILKNVCLYNATIRQELSTNLVLYYLVLRGLFLFCTEERMRHEGSTLLFLLLYNYLMKGSPVSFNLSLPEIVIKKLKIPFICQTYKAKTEDEHQLITEILLQDKYCLQSLQLHWNSEWFGGFNEVLGWDHVSYKDTDDFNKVLRLSNMDLAQLQSTSIQYCIEKYLKLVQNANLHQDVVEALIKLTGYVNLFKSIKYDFVFETNILTLPWKEAFCRFLNTSPSSREDNELLQYLLEFLTTFVTLYKDQGTECWISDLLKCETNPILTLLSKDRIEDADSKPVNKYLLLLITTCVSSEQHYLDLYGLNLFYSSSWTHVIEIIASNLKFSDSQHFYDLAYLDALLSCLVHLTASLGWIKSKNDSNSRSLLIQIVTGLCEMVGAFHCGKGTSAANSVMGLSITRHAVLILNHLLVEMQQANIAEWESCFIDEESGIEDNFYNLTSLWQSRDVVLRAGIFQLFAGLATSQKCAVNIVQEYKRKRKSNIWEAAINILVDHEEANIVRENIADFLTNLSSHTISTSQESFTLDKAATPYSQETCNISEILKLLCENNFYNNLELIFNCLYFKNKFYIDEEVITKLFQGQQSPKSNNYIYTFMKGAGYTKRSISSKDSDNNTVVFVITTPGFVKSIAIFLYNLMNFAPLNVTSELQNHGLIKVLFKCLLIPNLHIIDTKDLSLYCDILEMNRAICALLCRATNYSESVFTTILNARDCLNVLLSLLNNNVYNCEFSQLIYLRNRLWGEIFNLLGVLLNCDCSAKNVKMKNVLEILSSVLSESGNEIFLQSLCEAITSFNSSDLQNSALTSLTSLLKIEISTKEAGISSNRSKSSSVQNLLDATHTPRTPLSKQDGVDNTENLSPNSAKQKITAKTSSSQKSMRELYIHSLNRSQKSTPTSKESEETFKQDDFVIAGAELCRILLYMLEVVNLKGTAVNSLKKKSLVLNSLTNIVWVSLEAKKYALNNGLMDIIIKQIREFQIRLSLESVESLRRVSDKKRISSVLQEVHALIGLLTNFMSGDSTVKNAATLLGLSDLVHKLWIWILTQKNLLIDSLKMLCTFTTECSAACQSLILTSPVAGTGPRKIPSNVSLLHAVITLITKEMELISRTHDLATLELNFHLLHNCCTSSECRIILSKSSLLQSVNRLHPAVTKKQKPWEAVELIWLEFLETFSGHPEGQLLIAKAPDVLDLVILLTYSNRLPNKRAAIAILRNISFCSSNRPRLLSSADFLNVLSTKLVSGNLDEKIMVVTIIWALAANNQKAKLMLKCAGLETKLQEALKALHFSVEYEVESKVLDQIPEELEQRYRSQEIDKMIKKDKQVLKRQVKLLLLGAGESGKSTFLKQMRIIHGIKFEEELIKEFQQVIYQNVVKGMKVLVDARDKLNIPWGDTQNSEIGTKLLEFNNNTVLDYRLFSSYASNLSKLWKDSGIRRAFERRREFQLSDSVEYFLNNLDRIARPDYVPTNRDILHCRKATKGITEFVIPINNVPFLFVDVGGQRSQRQKWFQCFDSVTSILFLVSSSEFDQVLLEDRKTNRLEESKNIFDTIINNQIFSSVSIILFLNKYDLLVKKVKNPETDIRWYFPQFVGNPHAIQDVQEFILAMFTGVKREPKKFLYEHFTTAVDTENIKVVFNSVKDTILNRNLDILMLQ
ncbi:hypothetical protein Trydic_g13065 [Trypoxylus dichotomus]